MIKSFLILMLATTQLLAGGGGSVYLCVKNDGSFCCLDAGAETCRCCEEEIPVVEEKPSGCSCCSETTSSALSTEESAPSSSFELTLKSKDPCGCTHILIAQDQAQSKLTRMSARSDVQQLVQMAALPGCVQLDDLIDSRIALGWQYRPPTIESQALTVRSAVQIRC